MMITIIIFFSFLEYKCVKPKLLGFYCNWRLTKTLDNNHEISVLTLYWMLSILTFAQTSPLYRQ